jgi:hypothetical protein
MIGLRSVQGNVASSERRTIFTLISIRFSRVVVEFQCFTSWAMSK